MEATYHSITVTWSMVSDADSYVIRYTDNADSTGTLPFISSDKTEKVIASLNPSTTYTIEIAVVKGMNMGPFSTTTGTTLSGKLNGSAL